MNLNSTDNKSIRKFGFVAFIFFGCLFALGLWFEKPFPICLFGPLAVLGLGFILIPGLLKPVYSVWLRIVNIISRITTAGILTLAFYLVITPTALIKRLFSGAPLPLKPDKRASSYWVVRTEPAQSRDCFIKRY